MGTISKGGNSVIVSTCLVTGNQVIQERIWQFASFSGWKEGNNLFLQAKILSFPSRPHYERNVSSSEAHGKSQKLFPFCKNGGKIEVYPYTLQERF